MDDGGDDDGGDDDDDDDVVIEIWSLMLMKIMMIRHVPKPSIFTRSKAVLLPYFRSSP